MRIPPCYGGSFLKQCYKNFDTLSKKILILWVQRGIEESFGGVPGKKDKVRGKVKKKEVSYGD